MMKTTSNTTTGLRQWFTPKDIQIFFGSRTQAEINEAVIFFGEMPTSDVQKMRRYMAQLAGQRHPEATR